MPILHDPDLEALISRLAGPLAPSAQEAFRRAAENALTRILCLGEGAAYRAVSVLQRAFFTPPDDLRAAWDITLEPRTSKLTKLDPIGRDDCPAGGRVRTLLTR